MPSRSTHEKMALGLHYQQSGQDARAEVLYREVLEVESQHADAWHLLGLLAGKAGRRDAAVEFINRAIAIDPRQEIFHANLGGVLAEAGRLVESESACRQALHLNPRSAEAHNNLGNCLRRQQRLDEALAAFDRAIELAPFLTVAHMNRASALRRQGRLDDALASYTRALEISPHEAQPHVQMATIYWRQRRFDQALAAYGRVIERQPDHVDAQFRRAMIWLLLGDFEQGWPAYEWRWRMPGAIPRGFEQPLWDGRPLPGRTILLHAEQGLGDTLQFVRYGPMVKQAGGKVLLECYPKLVPLLSRSPGIDRLIARGEELPDFDVQAPLASLPGIFNTRLESIPCPSPYLDADPEMVSLWRNRIGKSDKFRVGIAWQGNPAHPFDRSRSVALAHFAALAQVDGVELYSLQKGAGSEQLLAADAPPSIIDLGSQLDETCGSFVDTAAVLRQLDLLVTCDTAIAHLGGALAVPTWIVLSAMPDWRWLLDRDDSPWYPTVRLFRQRDYGDWNQVFGRVAAALAELVPTRRNRPETRDDIPVFAEPAQGIRNGSPSASEPPMTLALPVEPTSDWGVVGLHLALELDRLAPGRVRLATAPDLDALQHPLDRAALARIAVGEGNGDAHSPSGSPDGAVLYPVGNDFQPLISHEHAHGAARLALAFFDDARVSAAGLERARRFDLIVTGSTWHERVLRSHGLERVVCFPCGVDAAIFHAAPRLHAGEDRFVVFAGGTLAYGAGPDLAVAAFREFQSRRTKAQLLAAWRGGSQQDWLAIDSAGLVRGALRREDRRPSRLSTWLLESGLPPGSFVELGDVPYYLSGQVLAAADVALFPDRFTNGAQREALQAFACGLPTILSSNTGHLDLIDNHRCYPLVAQRPVMRTGETPAGAGGGESQIDEIVARLEQVYEDRRSARTRGLAAVEFARTRKWSALASSLLSAAKRVCG